MSLQIVLIASGIVAACLGALFFLAADTAIRSFELGASDVASRLFARSTGAGLIAVAVINVIAGSDGPSPAAYAIVLGNLLLHILAIIVDFTEKFPKKGGWWIGFAIHIIFILGFGYYAIWWPAAAAAPTV